MMLTLATFLHLLTPYRYLDNFDQSKAWMRWDYLGNLLLSDQRGATTGNHRQPCAGICFPSYLPRHRQEFAWPLSVQLAYSTYLRYSN
jgi:hypothetical protein